MYKDKLDYVRAVKYVSEKYLTTQNISGKTFVISGASGLIGTFLVDVLMYKNKEIYDKCKVIAFSRNMEKSVIRFEEYSSNEEFELIEQDVNESITYNKNADFIIHLASNTHPIEYATRPIETIMTNVLGTKNMLDYASRCNDSKFLFASSVEIYGQIKSNADILNEEYSGYVNCNTLRAGYPESKRVGEALCQAYAKEKNINYLIARLPRVYGPTIDQDDSKASSQFIKNALNKEPIILKSTGRQVFSYLYVADVVAGLMFLLFNGENSQAYNIADKNSDVALIELAQIIAGIAKTEVVFDLPSETEKTGYSNAKYAVLNSDKINQLGWKANYTIKEGIEDTLNIMGK